MKNTMKIGFLVLMTSLLATVLLTGCSSALHNGTEMAISQVKIVGLPANPYAEGQAMVFSYNMGTKWVHDDATLFASSAYNATVSADGSLTYTFSPAIEITTPTLTFILIDPEKGWNTFQLDKKVAGKKGGDVVLDNQWSGTITPQKILGTVNGDDVTWTYE